MTTEKVKEVMTRFPFTASPKTTVSEALATMDKYEIRHMPVTDNSKVIGILSEREIRRFESFMDIETVMVRDVMVSNPYTVTHSTPLKEVVQTMENKKIGSAVVTSNTGDVMGIFTTTDALRMLADFLDNPDEAKISYPIRAIESYIGLA